MAAIVSIISKCGLTIEAPRRNQPNKSKLALYKLLLPFYCHLKQLYITNKMERFSYKVGCSVRKRTHITVVKRRLAWATDKQVIKIVHNFNKQHIFI